MQLDYEADKEAILREQMDRAKMEEVANLLKCRLCGGLLRFAHTLAECAHSFCQQCIGAYVNAFKGRNPEVKCPECRTVVESPFHRSVLRDSFKQSLVDLLDPNYAQKQQIILERVRRLFPDYNLSFLVEDYSPPPYVPRRRRAEKTRIMTGLAAAVKEKLGLSFQVFAERVSGEDSFQRLLEGLPAQVEEKGPLVLDVRPRSQHDFRFVGLNSRIQGENYLVSKLRAFLQKRVLLRLQAHEELARELIDPECNQLTIKVDLFFEERLLQDREVLSSIPGIDQQPIYYRLVR